MLPFRRILSATDFSEASYQAVTRAAELARCFSAEMLLTYVVPAIPALPPGPNYAFDLPEYEEALIKNAEERLTDMINEPLFQGLQVRPVVGYGDAAREIVRIAKEEEVGLIMIATHGFGGLRHLVSGSVTEKVVRLAECPVMTIRIHKPESKDNKDDKDNKDRKDHKDHKD